LAPTTTEAIRGFLNGLSQAGELPRKPPSHLYPPCTFTYNQQPYLAGKENDMHVFLLPAFLLSWVIVGTGSADPPPAGNNVRIKVHVRNPDGSTTALDPDRVIIEKWGGKEESLRTLLEKVDGVELRRVRITLRDAETKQVIQVPCSYSAVGASRPATFPGNYWLDFPRGFRFRSPGGGNGKMEMEWIGTVGPPPTTKVSAEGYEEKTVTLDEKAINEGSVSVFLKKLPPPNN
jgi:hypothetical protein